MRVNAFAATTAGAELTPYVYEAGELGPLEVYVDVTHCGICHTDVGVIDSDWGNLNYDYTGFPQPTPAVFGDPH